jgi:pimeloyl-ACP methyl ester carboxylesterase
MWWMTILGCLPDPIAVEQPVLAVDVEVAASDTAMPYDPVFPPPTWTTLDLGDRLVRYRMPAEPRALLVLFHGSGDEDLGALTEVRELRDTYLDAGIAFAMVDAKGARFDLDTPWTYNQDVATVIDTRRRLAPDLPLVLAGFSAGGAFATWLTRNVPDRSLPVDALVLHHSLGYRDWWDTVSHVPTLFVTAENDPVVRPEEVQDRVLSRSYWGGESVLITHAMRPLDADWLSRCRLTNAEVRGLLQRAAHEDWWSREGWPLFPVRQSRQHATDLTAGLDPDIRDDVSWTVLASLAGHVLSAADAEQEVAVVSAWLPD